MIVLRKCFFSKSQLRMVTKPLNLWNTYYVNGLKEASDLASSKDNRHMATECVFVCGCVELEENDCLHVAATLTYTHAGKLMAFISTNESLSCNVMIILIAKNDQHGNRNNNTSIKIH